ncbi:UvrD-helicase domain-containing protein [bacterium]|nr:UvrD-helicase domain-containing protein [bacterium]
MTFIADFHIHSHYSIATSKQLVPEYLDAWARIKGITVVGTGDFTHPGWLAELKEKLVPAEPGLFRLKEPFSGDRELCQHGLSERPVRFLLTTEISNIYKRAGGTRKVHNLVLAPDFETVERIQARLAEIGNITSDGRPILGLDSRDLLEICLEASDDIFFVPAHIWTPWFSVLGSKSGFDTIEACYGDLAGHIHAVETGLSADPPMHWMCSFLDRFTIISNSDAHSPEKLGREANLLDTDLSYPAIIAALRSNDPRQLLGTVEFFPEEGKYHYDGHRKCGVCWNPLQTLEHREVCSACGRPVTVGVMNRAAQLADRDDFSSRPDRRPYYSLIPLKEIISEIEGVGPASARVTRAYHETIRKLGPELDILLHLPVDDIASGAGHPVAEAVRRLRAREVFVQEGYDGEFGRIRVFGDNAPVPAADQQGLFSDGAAAGSTGPAPRPVLSFDLTAFQAARKETEESVAAVRERQAAYSAGSAPAMNERQRAAVTHGTGPALVLAGPGTGKTRVLTERIATLAGNRGVAPAAILAVTFTNKAAEEIRSRLADIPTLAGTGGEPFISTFHALGYHIISESDPGFRDRAPLILDEDLKLRLLEKETGCTRNEAGKLAASLSAAKQSGADADLSGGHLLRYQARLRENGLVDLDDLICEPVRLLQADPGILAAWRRRFHWFLVDEYQDINLMQYRLLTLLAGDGQPNLMAIGDPDQAIYGFRGADVTFIRRFRDDFPQAAVYPLTRSYRCSGTILRASRTVAGESASPALEGVEEGVRIIISGQTSDRAEAEFIARSIESMMGGLRFFSMDSGVSAGELADDITGLSDFAVLCRTARQMAALEKAFSDHSIPYQKAGSGPEFGRPPLSGLIQVLRWCVYPENELFRTVAAEQIRRQPGDLERIRAGMSGGNVKQDLMLIAAEAAPDIPGPELQRLLAAAEPHGDDYTGFLRSVALGTESDALSFSTEHVSLLTLHASKGLEFACVFIPGCEDGLLPYSLFENRAVDVDEERRLLYVGMTRAKKVLVLTHAARRHLFGRAYALARSPFLDSIEKELIQRVRSDYTRKAKKDDGQMDMF